jgi:hypothetical protein
MKASNTVAALLAVVLGACGGDTPSAPPSTALDEVDACALLTAEEIEEATGIAPGAPDDSGPASGPPMCNWPAADNSHPFAVSLLVAPSDNYTSFDGALARWQESAEGMGMEFDANDYQEVEGPGTVNSWMEEAGMLQAHRGNRMVQVFAQVAPDRDGLAASTALARHAMARLK